MLYGKKIEDDGIKINIFYSSFFHRQYSDSGFLSNKRYKKTEYQEDNNNQKYDPIIDKTKKDNLSDMIIRWEDEGGRID